ncbi:MAG TPA: 4-hydroxyphenylacetate 3-hydroxylase N-terminal domain-containing protein [Candidatus Binataceae bacterium]|nr:4-hydroxyphenylacetate 3-hydroxylase N-terminal domain-containing protein [Candidatus Binataceae bacterium]
MGARSGNNYLSSLRKLKAELWFEGERVADPTIHPAFVRRARAIASLYDLQMEHPGSMTVRLDDGDRAGLSFIQPRNVEEVRRRGIMFRRWAEAHGGTLEWTPDYCNTTLASLAAASQLLAPSAPHAAANLEAYYREARRRDWCLTQTRSMESDHGRDSTPKLAAPDVRLVDTTSEGIVVAGALPVTPAAPFAEELLVLSPALAFAVSCNTRGLKLVGHIGMDWIAEFDRVAVPSERVFLCGDETLGAALLEESSVVVNQMHQRVVNAAVVAELRLGLAASLTRDVAGAPDVQKRLAEMFIAIAMIRSCLHAAESAAHQDPWGQFVPARPPLDAAMSLYSRLYS